MITLQKLTNELRRTIESQFLFQNTKKQIWEEVNKFIHEKAITDKGNRRYPKYYDKSLLAFAHEYIEKMAEDLTIFCYNVDGKLYTTYNKNNPTKYYFKCVTDIPNYKDHNIPDKILWESKAGFFYGNGKEFYL